MLVNLLFSFGLLIHLCLCRKLWIAESTLSLHVPVKLRLIFRICWFRKQVYILTDAVVRKLWLPVLDAG